MDFLTRCSRKTCPTNRGLRQLGFGFVVSLHVGKLAPSNFDGFSDGLTLRPSENIGYLALFIGYKNKTALMVCAIKAVLLYPAYLYSV